MDAMTPARLREIKERWAPMSTAAARDVDDLAACVEQLVGALREIIARGHTKACVLRMHEGNNCRCHVATAQSALKGWEE